MNSSSIQRRGLLSSSDGLHKPRTGLASPRHTSPRRQLSHTSSPRPSTAGGGGSPYRDVFAHRAPNSGSAVLHDLTTTFEERVAGAVRRRAEQIISRYVRLNYVSREDATALESGRSQCEAFMNTVEGCLKAAARRGEPVEQAVARRAYEQWAQCNDLAGQISNVLDARSQPLKASREGARGGSPVRARQADASPSVGGSPLFADRRPGAPAAPRTAADELRSLTQLKHVDAASAARIYELFAAVHGPERGHVEFVSWLSLLPPATVQAVASAVQ